MESNEFLETPNLNTSEQNQSSVLRFEIERALACQRRSINKPGRNSEAANGIQAILRQSRERIQDTNAVDQQAKFPSLRFWGPNTA
jgi:hypothetical protein